MKSFKTLTNEQYVRDIEGIDQMSIGDRLDMINEEIEYLNSIVKESEELDEKIIAVANMVNSARFYVSFAIKQDLQTVMDMLESR